MRLPSLPHTRKLFLVVSEQCEEVFGVSPTARSRRRYYLASRWTAVYILRTVGRLSYHEIGDLLGMDHSSVINALRRIHVVADRDEWWRYVQIIEARTRLILRSEKEVV